MGRNTICSGASCPYIVSGRDDLRRWHLTKSSHGAGWDYVKIFVLLIVKCVQAYVNPFAVRNLLSFLETGRTDDTVVRPWVWVLALLLDPIIGSIIWELHVFTTSRVLVRTEAIITQLVFERALRMRATESPDTKPAAPGKAPTSAKSGSNLTGRLTNLVSTDLKNIVGGRCYVWLELKAACR